MCVTVKSSLNRQMLVAESDWAYMAGFLDADGHIYIGRRNRGSGSYEYASVGFTQADSGVAAMDRIASTLASAGVRFMRGRYDQSANPGHWQMRTQIIVKHQLSVIACLTRLMPHLVIKHDLG